MHESKHELHIHLICGCIQGNQYGSVHVHYLQMIAALFACMRYSVACTVSHIHPRQVHISGTGTACSCMPAKDACMHAWNHEMHACRRFLHAHAPTDQVGGWHE